MWIRIVPLPETHQFDNLCNWKICIDRICLTKRVGCWPRMASGPGVRAVLAEWSATTTPTPSNMAQSTDAIWQISTSRHLGSNEHDDYILAVLGTFSVLLLRSTASVGSVSRRLLMLARSLFAGGLISRVSVISHVVRGMAITAEQIEAKLKSKLEAVAVVRT